MLQLREELLEKEDDGTGNEPKVNGVGLMEDRWPARNGGVRWMMLDDTLGEGCALSGVE